MHHSIVKLKELIERGVQGMNIGLKMGLPRVEELVDGIQRATYTLLVGGTGSGKTSFALYSYIYKPLVENLALPVYQRVNFNIVYYSFEMASEILLAKLLCLHIWETYGIELSFKQIISRKEVLSLEYQDLVNQCIDGWLSEILQYITIFDQNLTSEELQRSLYRIAEERGTFEEDLITGDVAYTPNDPNEVFLVVLDHFGLLKKQKGLSKKENIDTASNTFIWFRNTCKYSFLPLIQMNRTAASMDRRNANMSETQLDDIKDSSGPSEDAETVIAIHNPYREKQATCNGYQIKWIRDKFRSIQILKNRFGEADKAVSVNFFGSIGYWKSMPKSSELLHSNENSYDRFHRLDDNEEPAQVCEDEPMKFTFTL